MISISDFKTLYDLLIGVSNYIRKLRDRKHMVVGFDNIKVSQNFDDGQIMAASPLYNPFGMKCSNHFKFYFFDPVLDVTMINHHNKPVLLTSVGVEVVSLAQFWWIPAFVEDFKAWKRGPLVGALPETEAVPIRDRIMLTIPDSWEIFKADRLAKFASKPEDLQSIKIEPIGKDIWSELKDPLYMDVNAPVRFLIHMDGFLKRMPNYSIIRLISKANIGNSFSEPLFICIGRTVKDFVESFRIVRDIARSDYGRRIATNLIEASMRFYDSDKATAADFINYIGICCYKREYYEEASWFCNASVKIREDCLPQDHPDLATSLNNLASCFRELGNYKEAEQLYKRAIAILENRISRGEKDKLSDILGFYAKLLKRTNRNTEADEIIKRTKFLEGEGH